MTKNEDKYNSIFEFLKDFKTKFVLHEKLIFFHQFHQKSNDFRKVSNKSSIKVCKFHEVLHFFQIN